MGEWLSIAGRSSRSHYIETLHEAIKSSSQGTTNIATIVTEMSMQYDSLEEPNHQQCAGPRSPSPLHYLEINDLSKRISRFLSISTGIYQASF